MQFLEWCIAHKTELIVTAVIAVIILSLIICAVIAVRRKRKKKSAVGKIYKTTDGYLGNYPTNKKTRRVATVDQRELDGAIAIVKIYSKDGKEAKIGKVFIPDLVLSPTEHSSLTKDSVVGRQVIIGIKVGDEYKPIHIRDFEATEDKLTDKELEQILSEVHNDDPKHRATHENKMRKWRQGFKKQ